jgi:hypothetical protein
MWIRMLCVALLSFVIFYLVAYAYIRPVLIEHNAEYTKKMEGLAK